MIREIAIINREIASIICQIAIIIRQIASIIRQIQVAIYGDQVKESGNSGSFLLMQYEIFNEACALNKIAFRIRQPVVGTGYGAMS
jgi:hypothetical protein